MNIEENQDDIYEQKSNENAYIDGENEEPQVKNVQTQNTAYQNYNQNYNQYNNPYNNPCANPNMNYNQNNYANNNPYNNYNPNFQAPYQPVPKKRMSGGVLALIISLSSITFVSLVALVVSIVMISSSSQSGSSNGMSGNGDFEDFFNNFGSYDNNQSYSWDQYWEERMGVSTPNDFQAPDIEVRSDFTGFEYVKTGTGKGLTSREIYEKVIDSTVVVNVLIDGESVSQGTGIFMTEDGFILTNSHVVNDTKSSNITVTTTDAVVHEAIIVTLDRYVDIAVLKIDGNGYKAAEFVDSSEVFIGDEVYAIGNSSGFEGSMTKGIISGLNRDLGDKYETITKQYIQTDAALIPGVSGGPLINIYGQVVGMNTAKIVEEYFENVGLSIPTQLAKSVTNELLEKGYIEGRVRLGITCITVSENEVYNFDVPQGVVVISIDEDSSFALTNVNKNDIIIAVDDYTIYDIDDLTQVLLSYAPGDTVTVKLYRVDPNTGKGKEFDVDVTLIGDYGQTQK